MRRFFVIFAAACTLLIIVASPAGATGPGGWDHLGHGSTATTPSLNGSVTALNTDNPGVLYVGGAFTNAGGHANADYIARWDGSSWSALGTNGPNGGVFAIAYHDGKVYAGGAFTSAGGDPSAAHLAVFDGSSWAPFCNSTTTPADPAFGAQVNALQIVGTKLYVGGAFADGAGIASADRLVACDLNTGAATSTVDSEAHQFSGSGVYALTADSNGTLYAGGGFTDLETIPAADNVAEYAGSGVWQAMGSGPGAGGGAVDDFVRSLAAHGTNVYVGTDAVNVGGIQRADHVARWNGSSWSALGSNSADTDGWLANAFTIDALDAHGSIVVAAGSFQNANGMATADDIAYFDGVSWRPIGSDGSGNGPINQHADALAITNSLIFLGGAFTSAGGDSLAQHVATHLLRLPDAMIGGTNTGPFVGSNVYSPSGAGEVRHVTINRGTSDNVYVKIQNDGLLTGPFTVTGPGGANGITAQYFLGGTNVTAHVTAGLFTPEIDPRQAVVLRMHIVVAQGSAASATLTVTARSEAGTPPDAVRVAVTAG